MNLMSVIVSVLLFNHSTLFNEFLVGFLVTIIITLLLKLVAWIIQLIKNCRKGLSYEEVLFQAYSSKVDGKMTSTIEYDGQIVEGTLLSSKIRIKNNGKNDLADFDIKNSLTIETIDRYQFLDVSIDPSNKKMGVNSFVQDNQIIVNWDLLKTNEYIDLMIMAKMLSNEETQGNQDESFFDSLKCSIRAKDVRGINRKASVKQKHTNWVYLFLTIITLFFVLFLYRITDKKDEVPCVYGIELSNNQIDPIPDVTIDNHHDTTLKDCYITYDITDTSWIIHNDSIVIKYKALNVLDSVAINTMTVKESDVLKVRDANSWYHNMHFATRMMLLSLSVMLCVVLLLLFRNRFL